MDNLVIEPASALLNTESVTRIRFWSAAAEALRTLHPEQLSLIYERKWFNMYVPKEFGGLELSLPKGLHLEESLAWADGSFGWTVTLCSGANWFIGFLDPQQRNIIFRDDKVCFAGSGHPSGTATMKEGGFVVNGRWKYASGAPHATILTANCLIEKDGELVLDKFGAPLIKSFFFLKEEVLLHDDWQSMGMRATASQSFSVHKLNVPANRSFDINPNHALLPGCIYRYPFLAFAETTLAVNSSGMAGRFIELAEIIFEQKKIRAEGNAKVFLEGKIAEAKKELQSLRSSFYRAVENAWQQCDSKFTVSQESLTAVSSESRKLAAGSRTIVNELYPLCGMVATEPLQEINRVWRNIHTASQHNLLLYPAS